MSYILSQHTITNTPKEVEDIDTRDAKHLSVGCRVAITTEGWAAHRRHKRVAKIAMFGALGAVALPALAGFGGIGMVIGGEGLGLSVLEIGVVGGAVGSGTAKAFTSADDKIAKELDGVQFIDAVGVVRQIKPRKLGERGHDVQIAWMSVDKYGEASVIFTQWHNPSELFTIKPL